MVPVLSRHDLPKLLLTGFALFLTVVLVAKIWLVGYAIGGDGLSYYAYVRSLLVDGDLHFWNEFVVHNERGHATPDPTLRTATDHVPNRFWAGPSVLWLPWFLVAHVATLACASAGLELEPDGYSALYQFFVPLGSIVYGLAGLVFVFRIVERHYDRERALLATIAIALGTNVIYYLANETAMSHALSLFAVSWFAWLWGGTIGSRSRRTAFGLGLVAGLMIMIRPQNAAFLLLPGLEWLGVLRGRRERAPLAARGVEAAVLAAGALVAFTPQLAAWLVINGTIFVDTYADSKFSFAEPRLWDTLFSARHGLLSWTPILIPALVGLVLFARRERAFGSAYLALFAIQWYVNAAWQYWWGGHAFGGRQFVNCSFVFAVGLAAVLDATRRWPRASIAVLAALVLWNLGFAAQYTLQMVPLDAPVDWGEVFLNQFRLFGRVLELLRAR